MIEEGKDNCYLSEKNHNNNNETLGEFKDTYTSFLITAFSLL
jgi:hypothetical protein